jgi:hypothetical protein
MTIKENFAYLKYFGPKLTFLKSIKKLAGNHRNAMTWKLRTMNNSAIEKYLKQVCSSTYHDFLSGQLHLPKQYEIINKNIKENNAIWTMWWDGEDNAPEIMKLCIASMRKFSAGHPVIVIDKWNYMNYVFVPDHFIKGINQKSTNKETLSKYVLGPIHLSDYIRCMLLHQYGGLWADGTVLFTDVLSDTIFTDRWNTLGEDNSWFIGGGRWSAFFMSCHKGELLPLFEALMLKEYFDKKRYFVHYLMPYHIVDILYNESSDVKEMIDSVKTENKKCLDIHRKYNQEVDKPAIDKFLSEQKFHKLSHKWKDAKISRTGNDDFSKVTWLEYVLEVSKNR